MENPAADENLTAAARDYLTALAALEHTRDPVLAVDLARALGVSRASVSRTLGALRAKGLVQRFGKALRLTGAGREIAALCLEKQRCFECLLGGLGLGQDCARAEAARLKHAVSPAGYAALRRAVREKYGNF